MTIVQDTSFLLKQLGQAYILREILEIHLCYFLLVPAMLADNDLRFWFGDELLETGRACAVLTVGHHTGLAAF